MIDNSTSIIIKYFENDCHVFICQENLLRDACDHELAVFYLSGSRGVDDGKHFVDFFFFNGAAKILLECKVQFIFSQVTIVVGVYFRE